MYIYLTLVVFPAVTNYISCESTSDLPKDLQQKYTLKNSLKDYSSTVDPLNILQNKQVLRAPNPADNQREEQNVHTRNLMTPSHLTKLSKTLSLSFYPTFSKHYFEPFERRSRPVTLVAFRKNGFAPRHLIKRADGEVKSLEVAELQSPYNDIGHFWNDEPGEV